MSVGFSLKRATCRSYSPEDNNEDYASFLEEQHCHRHSFVARICNSQRQICQLLWKDSPKCWTNVVLHLNLGQVEEVRLSVQQLLAGNVCWMADRGFRCLCRVYVPEVALRPCGCNRPNIHSTLPVRIVDIHRIYSVCRECKALVCLV